MFLIITPDPPRSSSLGTSDPLYPTALSLRQMDSSLHEVWTAAQGSPFIPAIGKDSQFNVGFWSLILGLLIAGVFALSTFWPGLQ